MNSPSPRPSWWRRLLRIIVVCLLVLVALVAARAIYSFRDRSPGYQVALAIDGKAAAANPRPLRVGFGRVKIDPDLSNPNEPVYIAGFSQNRTATGIHDSLWAVACVIDDGHTRLGVVALDAIGFFHDDVIRVREQLHRDWKIDYAIVCSTHNHSTPDLMGLWGQSYLRTGVNDRYRQQVIAAAAKAFGLAVESLQPTRLAVHEIPTKPAGLLTDTRKPEVYDPDIRVMHFTSPTNGATIGSIVGWANHPETVWSKNREITADFPGSLRDILENGVKQNGNLLEAGVGGIHLFVNGAVGGLMSTTPGVTVRDPYLEQDFKEPSHDKTRALGRQLASRIIPRLEDTNAPSTDRTTIQIQARTIELPLQNTGFLLAPVIGLIDRGHSRWKHLRTEVALVTIGEVSIACIPGEIYPEIVNGGIERAPGGDFDLDPVEVPPLRELMPGKVKFVFGLANDEIGYIIPKSEWDEKAPYLYNAKKVVYGEVNSVGPDAAGLLHQALKEMAGRHRP